MTFGSMIDRGFSFKPRRGGRYDENRIPRRDYVGWRSRAPGGSYSPTALVVNTGIEGTL